MAPSTLGGSYGKFALGLRQPLASEAPSLVRGTNTVYS